MKRDLNEDQLNQEVTLTLPLRTVLWLAEQEKPAASTPSAALGALPEVGSAYEGGIFAGVTLDGTHLAALVLLPGDFKGTWKEATDWAEKEDGVLPSRHDQLVLFKNLKAEFKDAWYWSGEQHADGAGYAWGQDFYYGGQGYGGVSSTSRARAVRRIAIR